MAEQHWSCGCFAEDGKLIRQCKPWPEGKDLKAHESNGVALRDPSTPCFREKQEAASQPEEAADVVQG